MTTTQEKAILCAVVFLSLASVALPASAHTISDPREGVNPDIHYVKLIRPSHGVLRWTTITYETFKPRRVISINTGVRLYLDTTGSRSADYVVNITEQTYPVRAIICEVRRPNGHFVHAAHFAHPSGKKAICTFRTGQLQITKGIRWREVWIESGLDSDAAPDNGWATGVGSG